MEVNMGPKIKVYSFLVCFYLILDPGYKILDPHHALTFGDMHLCKNKIIYLQLVINMASWRDHMCLDRS